MILILLLVLFALFVIVVSSTTPSRVGLSHDMHDAPPLDISSMGHKVIVESLYRNCARYGSCPTRLRTLTPRNGIHFDDILVQQYREHDAALIDDADYLLAQYSTPQVLLWKDVDKPVVVQAAVRYECEIGEARWKVLNAELIRRSKDGRSTIAANSKYDAAYINYFTGIDVEWIPSWTGDYATARYAPTQPEILFGDTRVDGLDQFLPDNVVRVREFYDDVTFERVASHPAYIQIPYAPSLMSVFEAYAMNVPLLVPSLDFYWELHRTLGVCREATWERTRSGKPASGSPLPRHPNATGPVSDPNDDSHPGFKDWLALSDWYQWENTIQFDSWDHLKELLNTTDFAEVSRRQAEENARRRRTIRNQWRNVLNRM